MLQELTYYTGIIREAVRLEDYVLPAEGLHLLVAQPESSAPEVQPEVFTAPKKKGQPPEMSPRLRTEILPRAMHIEYVDSNKAIADKKIHSASPYALKLKKQTLLDKSWMSGFAGHLARYFREALKKCRADHTPAQREQVAAFERFCQRLPAALAELPDYQKLKPADYVVVYAAEFTAAEYQALNQNYQADSLFNKNDYNETGADEQVYGLSNFYNGDNSKKPYLQHQTASFSIGGRISQADAQALHLFNQLRRNGAFSTNPLPVFIDHKELNLLQVSTVRQEGERATGFHGLMRTLCEKRPLDVGNYYLFYILGGEIRDVDYVSAFQYELEATIQPLFVEEKMARLTNVFDLEKALLQPLFSNQLVMQAGDTLRYRYFDDLDFDPKYQTPVLYEAIMRYRGAWYDYVYKSRRQAVSPEMFHRLVRELLLDDLRHDEWDASQRRHTRELNIRQKLNRWFSLWDFFNQPSTNHADMKDFLTRLRGETALLADAQEVEHSNELYAFVAGQVVCYIHKKSKSSNRSYTALEPFLQQKEAGNFKKALVRLFDMYKHETFSRRFNNPMSYVATNEPEGMMDRLMPFFLGGYFSPNLLYPNKKLTETTTAPEHV